MDAPEMDASAWSTQQLAEFIAAVSTAETGPAAALAAVERAAEALDADVAALVADGELVAVVGYPQGRAPVADLAAVRPGVPDCRLDVPGAGLCPASAATLAHPPGATLVVARQGPDGLNPEEIGLLRGMARVAALTMQLLGVVDAERAARAELERLAREQSALHRVATLVAKAAAPDEIFSAVAQEVAQLSGAHLTRVLRYEPDGSATVVGGWGDTETHLALGSRLTLEGEGVTIAVLRTGRPARSAHFAGPPGSIPHAVRHAGVKAGSGSPILVGGRLWGVMIALTRDEPLSADTEARLAGFTELVATAIANAQARMELRGFAEEQAALRRVATLVAQAAPPEEMFAAVTAEIGRVLHAESTGMMRYNADGGYTVLGAWNSTGAVPPFPLGNQIAPGGRNVPTLVFETGRPVRIDDHPETSGAAGDRVGDWGVRSAVGVPIKVHGGLWGVMILASRAELLPADAEARLAGFTELVATAVANAQARVELRDYADEQAALRQVATLVARAAPPEEVFAAVTAEVGRLLGCDFTLMNRYDPDQMVTVVGVWGRTDAPLPVPVGHRAPFDGRNVSTRVLRTGRPVRIDRCGPGAGPGPAPFIAAGIRSAAGAPINLEGRLWGVMIAMAREEPLPADAEARLAGFTELVGTAVANAEARAELTASRARIVATADTTRRRIERDLHDGAQQRLVSIALQLRTAQAAAPPEAGELAAQLDELATELVEVIDELREIARGIHPAILAQGGLRPALKAAARRATVPVELQVRVDRRLPEPIEVAAYYVVSEALTNASKHADASVAHVEVEVMETDDGHGILRVVVRDDGRGGADVARGSGLVGLQDRVHALGGRLSVQSAPGAGTTLETELPFDWTGASYTS